MRSWRGLGLVFSVLWLVGFGVWLWISSVGDRPEWYALQLQRCYSSSEIKREKLQPERYDSQLADVSREYQSCIVQAKTIFDGQMDELRSHVRKIMALNAGALAAIWLLVFLGVPVGRWVVLRFGRWA
jgi:Flp pilus assembly protein TadB